MKMYPDEIRVIFKHYPSALSSDSILAHEVAMAAAEQGQFWAMHDKLIAHDGVITDEDLRKYSGELKLDTNKFLKAVRGHRFKEEIISEISEAKGFGVTSAPTAFINGRKLVGSRSVDDFRRIIDEELGLTKTVQAPRGSTGNSAAVSVQDINVEGAPAKGPEGAPIVIVEFSDFQCPFCARAAPTVQDVLKRYPTQVRWAFKHFPLQFHQDAPLAHQAALAAGEQGKFWEMHDLIFAKQRAIKRDNLIEYAKELGLDEAKFRQDLDSGEYQARIDRDRQEGERLGVSGTPAFFVNGERLTGARPVGDFVSLIEKQLKAASIPSPPQNGAAAPTTKPAASSSPNPPADPVQINAFLDLGDPSSAQAVSALTAIRSQYASAARIEIRPTPQGSSSGTPSLYRATLAAGEQGKFREMQDLISASQGAIDRKQLMGFARKLKLDERKFATTLDREPGQEASRQSAAGGKPDTVPGATIFVNGKIFDGVPDVASLSERIEEELHKTEGVAQAAP